MPTRSREGAPAAALRDLGLPARAVSALARAGITSLEDLAVLTGRELAAVNGLGPGMIAAIRRVVPEPSAGAAGRPAGLPAAEEESPDAPAIPSFESLRDPQRRTALDVLMPPAAPDEPPAGPPDGRPAGPPSAAPPGPRPATYADLRRLAAHLARAAAGLPFRAVRWSVTEPARCLRRLFG